MAPESSNETIFDVFGDAYARTILAALSATPRSAKDLCDHCDLSAPTVYRRLRSLEDHGLVHSTTTIAADGNHYQVFDATFTTARVSLRDGTLSMHVDDAVAETDAPTTVSAQED